MRNTEKLVVKWSKVGSNGWKSRRCISLLNNLWTLWTLWTIDKYAKTTNCYYATPLCFYRVNRIFFGFRAFYLFFIQILAVILHRNSKSSHVHRTFIALPSHTRTRVTAMRRSSNAKARSSSLRLFQMRFARSRWLQEREIILKNFEKFCSFNYEQDSQD